jgi:hypothetical protein
MSHCLCVLRTGGVERHWAPSGTGGTFDTARAWSVCRVQLIGLAFVTYGTYFAFQEGGVRVTRHASLATAAVCVTVFIRSRVCMWLSRICLCAHGARLTGSPPAVAYGWVQGR